MITFRVTPSAREFLDELARLDGVEFAEVIRKALDEYAARRLQGRRE